MRVFLLALAIALAVSVAGCGSTHRSSLPVPTSTTRTITDTRVSASAAPTAYVTPVAMIQLVPPLARYVVYVDHLTGDLRSQVANLQAAAAQGNLPNAENAWLVAHSTWLELGQDDASYGAFGELGQEIDGTADGLPQTTRSPRFTGFHRIELDLWTDHDSAAAAADSSRLARLAAKLTPDAVQRAFPLKATALDSWVLRCHEILEDALRDSLSQDDDYGSNSDLASLSADVTATDEMLRVLGPLIRARIPRLVPAAERQLHTLDQAIAAAGGVDARRNLRLLPLRPRQALDAATGAALETLAPVSEILQVSVAGS